MMTTLQLQLTTTLAAELGHNTCANPAYNKQNFPANFTGTSWISQEGLKELVDSLKSDDSFNPVTPCHVSPMSVRTLFPNYAGKVISLCVPYDFGGNHVNVGIKNNSAAQAKASMLNEQMIGADGITIDWYGPNRVEDSISLLWKAQIETMSNFTFAIMIDTSGGSYSSTAQLESYLAYIKSTYFSSKAYRIFQGKFVLYLWGSPVPGVDYPTALASIGVPMYVICQGPGSLGYSWANAAFDWVQPWLHGVNAADPYNLGAKQSFINSVKGSAKGCVLALSSRFNGMLTKSVGWSQGKMLPGDNGKCWLAQASLIANNLLPNLTEIMLATGCAGDWEEGTQLASGIDNGITVSASVTGTILSWKVTGGTGDESTISYYRILASPDGINAAVLGSQFPNGSKTLDLSTISGWQSQTYALYVVAVGQPCVRNQVSSAVPYVAIQTLTGTFTGILSGTFVGSFTPTPTARLNPPVK